MTWDADAWVRQGEWDVRFEWGPAGVLGAPAERVVIVDVLRFTTAVDAAVSAGAVLVPYRWGDGSAGEHARSIGARLAGDDHDGPSLSPASLAILQPGERVVLPSPNGSTCAALAAETGAVVVAACLRNAAAVGAWLSERPGTTTVVACGERWPDGSLRPALEDLLGAGAVIDALGASRSPEAESAAAAWRSAAPRLATVLQACASGRELAGRGLSADVDYAAAAGDSAAVPVLGELGFVDGRPCR